jgi:hypothetical protein
MKINCPQFLNPHQGTPDLPGGIEHARIIQPIDHKEQPLCVNRSILDDILTSTIT